MANTFGTFLSTIKRLESSSRPDHGGWPQSEVFAIGKMLLASGANAAMPIKAAMSSSGLPQEAFFGAVVAGRDKGIFQIDEQGPEPVVSLTGLGRSLVG